MADTYSLYEAKAKFSEIIRKVREGRSVTVSYRGSPVAEIRPVADDADARLRRLEEQGIITPRPARKVKLKPIARRPGALARFLRDRD